MSAEPLATIAARLRRYVGGAVLFGDVLGIVLDLAQRLIAAGDEPASASVGNSTAKTRNATTQSRYQRLVRSQKCTPMQPCSHTTISATVCITPIRGAWYQNVSMIEA